MADKLWIAHGLSGLGGSVRHSWVEMFERAGRETPKHFVVLVRGREKLISKGRLNKDVFVSEEALTEALKRRKAEELRRAERAVAELSVPVNIEVRAVPPEEPPAIKPGDLKL